MRRGGAEVAALVRRGASGAVASATAGSSATCRRPRRAHAWGSNVWIDARSARGRGSRICSRDLYAAAAGPLGRRGPTSRHYRRSVPADGPARRRRGLRARLRAAAAHARHPRGRRSARTARRRRPPRRARTTSTQLVDLVGGDRRAPGRARPSSVAACPAPRRRERAARTTRDPELRLAERDGRVRRRRAQIGAGRATSPCTPASRGRRRAPPRLRGTLPDVRGTGVGVALVERGLRVGAPRRLSTIVGSTGASTNLLASRFWPRRGFTARRIFRCAVDRPATAVMPRLPMLSGSRVAVVNAPDDAVVLRPPPPLEAIADVAAAVRDALRFPLSGPAARGARHAAAARRRSSSSRRSCRCRARRTTRGARRSRPRSTSSSGSASRRRGRRSSSPAGSTAAPGSASSRRCSHPAFARRFHGRVEVHDAESPDLVHARRRRPDAASRQPALARDRPRRLRHRGRDRPARRPGGAPRRVRPGDAARRHRLLAARDGRVAAAGSSASRSSGALAGARRP